MDVPNGVVAPLIAGLLLALITGGAAWARSISKAAAKVGGLADQLGRIAEDVRDLAAAATESALTSARLDAHMRQADERWSYLVGHYSTAGHGFTIPLPRIGEGEPA